MENGVNNEKELGIDISVHNADVNVKKVRDAGYKRIIIRAGYGKNNIDQKFIPNAEACVNLSEPAGIYWFSYGYTVEMAEAEAEYALAQARKFWTRCPVAFDLEYDTVSYARKKGVEITKNLATKMAIAFLKKVADAGYIPVLYTNKDYAKRYFDIAIIKEEVGADIYIWYARYTSSLQEKEKNSIHIWQKTSKGKVPGINGNVDIDEFFADFESASVNTEANKTCNINILNFQKAANLDGYTDQNGNKLVEDGIDGKNTQYVRKKVNLKAKKSMLSYVTGSSGYLVRYWQKRLTEMGFKTKVDGEYGKDTREKTVLMQKKYLLSQDGVAGYDTISTSFYN